MPISAVYKKGVIKPLEKLDLAENEEIEIEIKRMEGNLERVMKFAGIWKNMPKDKLKVFSEILEERERFSRGRVTFDYL